MKTFIKTLGLAAALMLAIFAGQVRAQDASTQGDGSVSFQTFYDQLSNQGSWIQTDQYGYVFQPTESDPNWRPYTYGHWVNTEAGMTWVSDEPFGWATYHYGRWTNLDGYGWVWVPGYTWAPAWVSWRDGSDEVGWAPLPPDSAQGIDFYNDGDYAADFGFHIGDDCDVAFGIGAGWYNFCPTIYIGDRDCWRHFRDHRDNFAFIGQTRNVTNINFRRDGVGRFGHIREGGPSVAMLNAHARTHIETARLTTATRDGNVGLRGNALAVYAPRVDRNTVKTARPTSVSAHIAKANVNRGTNINQPLAVNSHVRPAGASAEQIHAATVAQSHVTAGARVATAHTRITRPLTQPLTSLRTTTRPNAVAGTTRSLTPAASTDSRFTGERAASVAPTHTGATFHHEVAATPAYHPAIVHSPTASVYHPQAVSHPSASQFHAAAPVYHPQAMSHPSVSQFHAAAPIYHPQASFHAAAPAYHPQASFHAAAPAAHVSGGGGHPSGGGAVHASAGGGQPANRR